MIVYQARKAAFVKDTFSNDIEVIIGTAYTSRTGRTAQKSEVRAWAASLFSVAKVLNDQSISDDCGVAVEYGIPQTSKRVDVLLSGIDSLGRENLLIVELKQWEVANKTELDGVVRTRFGGGVADTSHPSYQAWSYAELLRNFNEVVDTESIPVHPCAYLHNCNDAADLLDPFYRRYFEAAPIFLKGDSGRELLRSFISKRLVYGDGGALIRRVDSGKVRPSKQLVDAVRGMLHGVVEFTLVDEQKVVFETVLAEALGATADRKKVIIVEGGPGTGKSVVAVNLLARLLELGKVAKYVSKNRAPRQVIERSLEGHERRTRISALFGGSGQFYECPPSSFDVLIVDEAHRLNAKSGMFANKGENQVGELIAASKCTVFFLDEQQKVTWKDIGSRGEIMRWAAKHKVQSNVPVLNLPSQFRCAGSDGYVAWLDDVLQIRETANRDLDVGSFDVRVFDDPHELRRLIEQENRVANRARMVAGYCWDWKSKKSSADMDIVIPERSFAMQWNFASDQGLWIRAAHSVKQAGCIHTCQGLEVDYIGVIIGPDFVVRNGIAKTLPERRSKHDQSIKGYKKLFKEDQREAARRADEIIKNTYRTLMTRGMKGCFVYCSDPETARYFRSRLKNGKSDLPLRRVAEDSADYD